MSTQDKKLACRDCGKEFIFTSGEQDFFESKGFGEPSRCTDCRKKKKGRVSRKDDFAPKPKSNQIYEIVCSSCSKKVDVPFEPRNPAGVLCAECFEKKNKPQGEK